MVPHHPKANIGVVLIHQYYQQIIRLQEQQLICCVKKIGKKRHTCQEEQVTQTYWYTHEGKFKFPAELPPPGKHRNNMCLSGLAVHHLAYETLKRYATEG